MFFYKDLMAETEQMCRYGAETGTVGQSELGQTVPYVFLGQKNGNYMIVQGAIHAREHLTALITLCLAKFLLSHPRLTLNGGIYFVPMVNPDGVRLCQEGLDFVSDENRRKKLLEYNGGSCDFSNWKANIDGVDLNVNFDAEWGKGTNNVFAPAPQNYVGSEPFSAAESRALADFTRKINPCVTLSYHLKGEEVYYEFGQTPRALYRDKRYADAISSYTGYKTALTKGSVGGYKDWCIQTLHVPAFTLEVGSDRFPYPFPYTELRTIVRQNEDLPRRLLNTVARDKQRLGQVADLEEFYSQS